MRHLFFGGVAHANHSLFHLVGGILANIQPKLRRNKQRNGPGLSQFQGRNRVFVDKGLFNSRRLWRVFATDVGQLCMQIQQAIC
jgi:hypothetical protein